MSKRLDEIEKMNGLLEEEKQNLFIEQCLLEFLYESLFPFNSPVLQWMNIEDGKRVKEKIAVLTKFMNEEEISEGEWDEVLNPERYRRGLVW